MLQISTILIIESVNLWLLCQQDNILDTIKDYLALGCIAEFDDSFVSTYRDSNLRPYFVEFELPIENFRKNKIVISK